jgi:hypothetical protein
MKRPTVSLRICNSRAAFEPGDVLECECSVCTSDELNLHAVETSVIWMTEGKGEEDLGVHFFDRRSKNDVRDGDLGTLYRFKTRLPNSPLSYDGKLIKIHWVVRVCVFYDRGKELRFDQPFFLRPARLIAATEARDPGDDSTTERRRGA